MAKSKTKTQKLLASRAADSSYFLKLVLFMVIGSQWLWLIDEPLLRAIPLPLGLLIGLYFALRERLKPDRKIVYALLLVSALIGFYGQIGFFWQVL